MQDEYAKLCGEILNAVLGAKDGRRPISQVFKSLPDRNSFPEYYKIIPEPMSLEVVKAGLAEKRFKTPSEFFKDLHLVFLNAKYFNEETSQIWKDAKALEDLIHEMYNAQTAAGLLPPATPIRTKPYKGQSGAAKISAPKAPVSTPAPAPAAKSAPTQTSKPIPTPAPVTAPVTAPVPAPTPAPIAPPPVTAKIETPLPPTSPSMTPGGSKATRPRGRPPKGKIVDETSGMYVSPPPGTILPIAPPKPRMPLSTGSFSQHGGGPFGVGYYGNSMGPPTYNSGSLPAFATPGPSGSSKHSSDRPLRGPPELGELIPTEITRQLPVPPLNDPREFSTIETQERIRHEADIHLPRWTGPEETLPDDVVGPSKGDSDDGGAKGLGGIVGAGWWGDSRGGNWYPQRDAVEPGDWQARAILIVDVLNRYKDIHNVRIAKSLDKIPEETTDLTFLSFSDPLSISMITQRVKARAYPTMRAFDMDMTKLFEKGRRFYEAGSKDYGDILALQRLYNSLTSSHEPNAFLPTGPDPFIAASKISFAGFPAGPGRARVMPENGRMNWEAKQFTSPRASTSTKDKVYTAEARSKGMAYRMGDFVHLINPDDPTRPIIGHIFKTYAYTKGTPCHMVSVCWYFRSEQIIHTADRTFYQNEVFKSSHYVDHPVEDILEKVGCQFSTKYSRGRPPAPEWYPGWPLYVCVSRYNERERQCVKIKNWNSCIPEELRKSSSNPPVAFDQAPHSLRLLASPFITGAPNSLGPGATGGIIDGVMQKSPARSTPEDEDDEERPTKRQRKDRGGTSTPVPVPGRSAESPSVDAAPTTLRSPLSTMGPLPVNPTSYHQGYASPMPGPAHPYPVLALPPPAFSPGHLPMLQPPGGYMLAHPAPAPYRIVPSPGPQHTSITMAPSNSGSSYASHSRPGAPPLARSMPERGLATAVGGPDRLLRFNDLQQLPQTTLEMVDHDPVSGQMYWFSGPPVDHPIPQQPRHSPAYLDYLAGVRLKQPVADPALSYGTKSDGALMTLAQTEMDTAKLLDDIDGLAGMARPLSGASGSGYGTTSLAGASATGMEDDDVEAEWDGVIFAQMAERLGDFLEAQS